jgi:hypothetical protein
MSEMVRPCFNWRDAGRGQEEVDLESVRERPPPTTIPLPLSF